MPTVAELQEKLRKLNVEIEALDKWTDKHPYPSGMNKLLTLCQERDSIREQLDEQLGGYQ